MYTTSLLVAGLASVASAHIKMSSPVPYGAATLDNSPLEADGSNFPCKQRPGVYDAAGASNVFSQGSTQQLEFVGTAVHGGGSCQVSITTDVEPDANSVWKVIKSIEGGCPAKGADGNIGNDAAAKVPFSYDYTIPAELAAGNYTLAWTWQNKIGNRELYMNCAPLQVTGDKSDDGLLDTLPDMFVANIGNGCETTHGTDVKYPNPGKDVDQFNGNTDVFEMPSATGCQKPTGGSGGGNGGAQPTQAPEPSSPAEQPSIPGGVFITAPAESSNAPAPTEAPSTPEPTPEEPVEEPVEKPVVTNPELPVDEPVKEPGNSEPIPETPGTGSGDAPSGGFAVGTACSEEGDWNCVGGSSFQRCASGAWSSIMALAQGVECSGGQSATLNMAAIKGKRSLRRASRII
jgi:hypothetical protein